METPLRVVVIGGVACGPKTACRLKRLLLDAEVTMIERGSLVSYGACGLPYYVEGVFSDLEMLSRTPVGIPRDADFFRKVKGFKTLTGVEALRIDRRQKTVRVKHLTTGAEEDLPYDKLVLSTGSRPLRPPISGLELDRVWFMRHPEDARSLVKRVEEEGLRRAVVIGAGYIGIEMAEALIQRGLEVSLVEMADQIMPQFLDYEIAALSAKHLRQKGVRVILGERVLGLEGESKVTGVRTDRQSVPADLVVIGVGVQPNEELAREAGLQCAPRGGIVINSHCQTSDPDIYAGGDCVVNRSTDPACRDLLFFPLGSTANKHGRVIADHIAGISSPFAGVSGTAICKAFDYNIGRTGLTEKQAREKDPDIVTAIWSGPTHPHYIPHNRPLVIKMVASRRDRKLLGVQVVGPGEAAKRLDVAATALFFQAGVDQIANLDLGYAPPYSSPLDPLAAAAHLLLNKMNGIARSISPLEAKERMDRGDDILLLDARTPQEFQKMRLPHEKVVHIPLGALRERANELPRDKDIIAFCMLSMRGYEAQRILNAAGFDRVWFFEGGLVAWPFEVWTAI